MPHVVDALARAPDKADHGYFQFPAWVEICRAKRQVEIPEDLRAAYLRSLAQLPSLVAAASSRAWDKGFLACALAAIAAAKGLHAVAEAVLELTLDVAEEFMEWFFTR